MSLQFAVAAPILPILVPNCSEKIGLDFVITPIPYFYQNLWSASFDFLMLKTRVVDFVSLHFVTSAPILPIFLPNCSDKNRL
jgi:hypothetical protein